MNAPMPVRAYPLNTRCWQLDRHPDDAYSPHFATEDEALTEAEAWVEDWQPIPCVVQLPTPCWVATCGGCGADMEHVEYGPNLHYATAGEVEEDAPALVCVDGCERPAPVVAIDPTQLMDPLPGFDQAIARRGGAS